MHYYLFYPTISITDSPELLNRFMCIGESIIDTMEAGMGKIRQVEADSEEGPLINLITGFQVVRLDREHNPIIKKVIDHFGLLLEPRLPAESGKLSMVTLLLIQQRWDVIAQIIDTVPFSHIGFTQ